VRRAFSFIGLGLVLVGIGYLYQRLLFRKPPPGAAPMAPAHVGWAKCGRREPGERAHRRGSLCSFRESRNDGNTAF